MGTVRGVACAALATVMSLTLTGIVASQLAPSPAVGRDADVAYHSELPPLANVSAVSCAPPLDHVCRRRRRRWAGCLHHRDEQQRLHLVRRNSSRGGHQPLDRFLPVCLGLLRRRWFGNPEVEQWWVNLDGSGLDLSGSVHLVFHDR